MIVNLSRPVWLNVLSMVVIAWAGAGCHRDYAEDQDHYRRILGTLHESVPAIADSEPVLLTQAVRLTNHTDERLGLAGENYVQAIISRQRAAAAFLPTLDLIPSYTRRSGDLSGSGGRDELNVGVVLGYNVFDGFRKDADLASTDATIESRAAALRDFQASILLDTVVVFYEVLRRQGSVDVLRNTVALQDARVKDITVRRDTGLARPLEVSQAQAQAAATRVLLIASETDVRNSRSALALLTGAPMDHRPLEDDFTVPDAESIPPLETWLGLAQAERPDIVAADRAVAAAKHDVDFAFGQYYPSVTLNLEYLLVVDNYATENQWNGILQANLPIFSAGRIEADVRAAWSRLRQAALSASRVRRVITENVTRAYQTFESARDQVAELNRRISAAELALRQAEGSYDAGLATNLERLTAQDELLAARLDLLTQQFVYKVAYLSLLRTAGQLQQELGMGENAPPG